MTRLVHIGDLHLGPGPRNVDRLKALDQIIDENLNDPHLGAWLIPGDLNHGRMTIDDRNALAPRLQTMANHAPVIGVTGNHDLPGDLEVFERLYALYRIRFFSTPQVVNFRLATEVVATCFVLPYPTKAGLVAAGVSKSAIPQVAVDPLEAIFRSAAMDLRAARDRGELTFMIGHVNVGGAIVSTGQPNIGREIELNPALLALLGDDCYKGLNHIHRSQEISGAWYPGSVCRLDFGEMEPKGYLVAEYTQLGAAGGPTAWTYDVVHRPLPVAPMLHIEGELTREGFDWRIVKGEGPDDTAWLPMHQLAEHDWSGCDVRVRYRFDKHDTSLDRSVVEAEFKSALRAVYEPVAVADRAARAPEVSAARTLEEKLRAWARHNGIEMAEGVIAKLALLESSDAQELLANLVKRLEAADREEVAA